MKDKFYILRYLLLLVAQAVIWNYCSFSQFLLIALLPAMILCLPVGMRPVTAMLAAFAGGLAADFLCGAPLGLASLASVPVALVRRGTIRLVFGSETLTRGEELSPVRQGWTKITLATVMLTALFLVVYIAADSAGTRPFWIDAVKFAVSLAASTALSLPVAAVLCTEPASKWR